MKKHIKLFAALALSVLTLAFASCTKSNEELIVGKWNANRVVMTVTISGAGEDYDGTQTDEQTFEAGEAGFTFQEDGTLIIWSRDGEDQTANYTVNDNTLTITIPGVEVNETYTIELLNKKQLSLKSHLEMSNEGVTMSMDTEIHCDRA